MSTPGRPKIAGHADAQRARILDAAKQCFIEEGFHAATMAEIAARAGMSAGLIYRYFESKNAIVLAIIERELQYSRGRIAAVRAGNDHAAELVQAFRDFQSPRREGTNATLHLEMSAEATRVPEVARAARDSDRLVREELRALLARPARDGGLGMAARHADAFALLLQVVVDGLAVRAAREPTLDTAKLRRALAPVIEKLG